MIFPLYYWYLLTQFEQIPRSQWCMKCSTVRKCIFVDFEIGWVSRRKMFNRDIFHSEEEYVSRNSLLIECKVFWSHHWLHAFNFIGAKQTPGDTLKIVMQATIVYSWREERLLFFKEADCCMASLHSSLSSDNLHQWNNLST